MKKSSIIGVLILCFAFWGKAQVRNEIHVPDPEGYRTLKCDFHIHTVFSDGLVWPTVRVDEAYREGLDAIALTEHLEYRPHRQDIIASHNRSYEIAEKTARNNQVILIRGSEITRPMAPGHFNAIFLSDCDALNIWIRSKQHAGKMHSFSGIIRVGTVNNPIRPSGGMNIPVCMKKDICRV